MSGPSQPHVPSCREGQLHEPLANPMWPQQVPMPVPSPPSRALQGHAQGPHKTRHPQVYCVIWTPRNRRWGSLGPFPSIRGATQCPGI